MESDRCSRSPVVRRRFHAGEDDADVPRLRALDDAREVVAQLLDRQAAKAVVAAERHDQHAHVAVERPVEPRETVGGGVARDTGVDDLVGRTVGSMASAGLSDG